MKNKLIGCWAVEEFFAGTRHPIDDQVPTALDETRLHAAEKLMADLEKINADHARAAA